MFHPYLISFGLLFGTTVGAGIFALPGLVQIAGFIPFVLLALGLSLAIIVSHWIYAKTIFKEKGVHREDLIGLSYRVLGSGWGRMATLAVGGGLSLSLVAMLLLGADFLVALFPSLGASALLAFWFVASLPLFLKVKGLGRIETVLTACLIIIVAIVFFGGISKGDGMALYGRDAFSLFGPLLYALAGWTVIPTITRVFKGGKKVNLLWAVLPGTLVAAILYALFSFGMLRQGAAFAANSTTGLSMIDPGLSGLLAIFGLCAIWTTYVPVARELLASFSGDADKPSAIGLAVVGLVPPILILLGATNVIGIITVAGGVFLSLQYVLLLSVSERVLKLKGAKFYGVAALAALFLLAALAEIYYVVVRYL